MIVRIGLAVIGMLSAVFLLAGCGHDAAWNNGYNYATDNSVNAQDVGVAGFSKADWCQIARKYAIAGPTGGDFVSGCIQGLSDSGVYGN
jgi:hypothetical protein